jgi:hypothetical protein
MTKIICPVHGCEMDMCEAELTQDAEDDYLTTPSTIIGNSGGFNVSARIQKKYTDMTKYTYMCPHGCSFSYQPKNSYTCDGGIVRY